MIKWHQVYAQIAVRFGCTADYVRRIDAGEREVNSDLAKKIKKEVDRIRRDAHKFTSSVAA